MSDPWPGKTGTVDRVRGEEQAAGSARNNSPSLKSKEPCLSVIHAIGKKYKLPIPWCQRDMGGIFMAEI